MLKKFICIILLVGAIILTPQVTYALWYKDNIFVITLQDYLQDNGCWFCGIFTSLFKAINVLASTIFVELSQMFLFFLGFGLLFMMVFKIGKMLVQLQEVDLMQFLGDLFKPLGRAMIAAILLSATSWGGENIFNILITPFLEIALSLSSSIVLIMIT